MGLLRMEGAWGWRGVGWVRVCISAWVVCVCMGDGCVWVVSCVLVVVCVCVCVCVVVVG